MIIRNFYQFNQPWFYSSRAEILRKENNPNDAIINYSMAIKLNPRDHEAYFQRAAMYEKVSSWFPNFFCTPVNISSILNCSSNLSVIFFHIFVDWQDAIGFGWLHDVQEDTPNQNWCHFKACHVLFPTEVCIQDPVVLF